MLLFNHIRSIEITNAIYFNTSNVTIQLIWHYHLQDQKADFNTSNVTIQRFFVLSFCCHFHYFNTSNVTIQRIEQSASSILATVFQYI